MLNPQPFPNAALRFVSASHLRAALGRETFPREDRDARVLRRFNSKPKNGETPPWLIASISQHPEPNPPPLFPPAASLETTSRSRCGKRSPKRGFLPACPRDGGFRLRVYRYFWLLTAREASCNAGRDLLAVHAPGSGEEGSRKRFAESCLQMPSCDIVPGRERHGCSHGTGLPLPRHGATGWVVLVRCHRCFHEILLPL